MTRATEASVADIQLDLLAMPVLSGQHSAAAQGLDDTADSMPAGVDAGAMTGRLLALLGGVCGTVDELAQLNRAVAAQLHHVVLSFDGTEEQVSASFNRFADPEGQGAGDD